MKKIINDVCIQAFFTLIVTTICNYLFIYIFKTDAKIELISSKLNNSNYQNVISVKNLNSSEYLDGIELLFDDEIAIQYIEINGEKYEEKKVRIENLAPKEIITIIITSKKEISKQNITIIKNKNRVEFEKFNNYTNYKLIYFILIFIYVIINSIAAFILMKKTEKNNQKTRDDLRNANERCKKIEQDVSVVNKKVLVRETIHIKEMKNMERELEFYKKIVYKLCNKTVEKDELEKIIMKELKIFKNKNNKRMSYSDVYKLIMELQEEHNNIG